MAIVKKLGAPYTITTTNNSDTITLATTSPLGVIIAGNLTVIGNTSQVESNVTSITDNFVTLNAGETGHGVSLLGTTSGIIIDRGLYANVKLQWQEGANVWQISDNTGLNFANINSGGLAGDPNPTLSANLNTFNSAITSNVGSVVFGSNIQLDNTITTPSVAVTNATIIYAATPAGGTSGVYVLNGQAANQELVTKARALGFSLLL